MPFTYPSASLYVDRRTMAVHAVSLQQSSFVPQPNVTEASALGRRERPLWVDSGHSS